MTNSKGISFVQAEALSTLSKDGKALYISGRSYIAASDPNAPKWPVNYIGKSTASALVKAGFVEMADQPRKIGEKFTITDAGRSALADFLAPFAK